MCHIPMSITNDMNSELDKRVTNKEILATFNQVDPCKALCVDGLSWLFYKKNWGTIGKEMLKFCHETLNGDRSIEEIHDTMVVLIPKVKNPINMTHFRPISLCRVIYKIISKVFANRIMVVL